MAILLKWWWMGNPTQLSDAIAFKPISNKQAQQLFIQLRDLPCIEFNYANNYCEDRAHAMAKIIDGQNITTAKVWIFVKGIFKNKFPKVLKVEDKNKVNKKGYLGWKYHVAPVVVVNRQNRLDTLVIDPALCSEPVTINEWQGLMNYKNDIPKEELFWIIKDWKYHMYRVKKKKAQLFEPWKKDKKDYLTKKGLCQGKILYEYIQVHADSTKARRKAKKFKLIPKSYKDRLKPCINEMVLVH